MFDEDEKNFMLKFGKIAGLVVGALVLAGTLLANILFVDQGERGVVTLAGKVSRIMEPGLNIKIPFVETVYWYSVRAQKFQGGPYKVASSDSLLIDARIAFVWRYMPGQLECAYTRYGTRGSFEAEVLRPVTEQYLKETTGAFASDQLVPRREEVAALLLQKLRGKEEEFCMVFDQVAIEDITLPARYREAILAEEEKQREVLRQKHELERQELKAQELVQTANAEAEAIRIKSEAQAAANRRISESLTPLLVRQNEVEVWDGKLPRIVAGEGSLGLFLQDKKD